MKGRIRKPWKVVLAGALTGGLYFPWFYFIALREVDFAAGRRHSPLLFLALVPVAGPFFAYAYTRRELDGLAADARRLAVPATIRAPAHALVIVGGLAPAILLTVAGLRADWTDIDPRWLICGVLGVWGLAPGAALVARDVAAVQHAARARSTQAG